MAKLNSTEKENNAETYLQWSDASLGKAVKKIASAIMDHHGDKSVALTACATFIASFVAEKNAISSKFEYVGITKGDKSLGDWEIIVKRKKKGD